MTGNSVLLMNINFRMKYYQKRQKCICGILTVNICIFIIKSGAYIKSFVNIHALNPQSNFLREKCCSNFHMQILRG